MKPWIKVAMIIVGIVALALFAWGTLHAAAIRPDLGAVWLTAIGVGVAALALVAALAAAVFAYPAYRDWRMAQPRPGDIRISIEATSARS
jgi:hypothetical protein